MAIVGPEGCGKSFIVKLVGKIIEEKHFMAISNAGDVVGKFTGVAVDKVLVLIDEASATDLNLYNGPLKFVITDEKMRIEKKGHDVIYVDNYVNLVIVTNEREAIPAGKAARRFCAIDATDEYLNTHDCCKQHYGAIC